MTTATPQPADLPRANPSIEALRGRLLQDLQAARWRGDGATWGSLLSDLSALEREALHAPLTDDQHRRAAEAMARLLLERWMRLARPEEPGAALFTDTVGVARYLRGEAAADSNAESSERELILAQLVALALGPPGAEPALPIAALADAFALEPLDVWFILVLHLAQVDPFFRRACSYVQNDLTRKEVDLTILCGMLFGRPGPLWALGRQRLHATAPLRRHRLVDLADGGALLEVPLRLAEPVVGMLDGWRALSADLAGLARWQPAPCSAKGLDPAVLDRLDAALDAGPTLLVGPEDHGRAATVEAAAARRATGVLALDGRALLGRPASALEDLLARAARDARLLGGLVWLPLPGVEELGESRGIDAAALARAAAALPCPLVIGLDVLAGDDARALGGLRVVELSALDATRRADAWAALLDDAGLDARAHADLDALARRWPLSFTQLRQIGLDLAAALDAGLDADEDALIEEVARRQLHAHRGGLTELVQTPLGWGDLVLPEQTLERLMELISFARYHHEVFHAWGFAQKLPNSRGLTALLHGAPGTGKTMVAGLVARELGKPLLRVNLAEVTSKWIGETEKNLARVFDEARRQSAVLLFDEADALFGKRTEVKTSTDRYANMNVNYLLQAVEAYDGVVILTTNLETSIDEAFKRRIRFKVEFNAPDEPQRRQLWASMFPPNAALAPDIDLNALARTFELSGGTIKEAALRAAFIAAERGTPITQDALWTAAERLYRESGRVVLAAPRTRSAA